jgi:hypothetical protein
MAPISVGICCFGSVLILTTQYFNMEVSKIVFSSSLFLEKSQKELGDADGLTEEKVEELVEEFWRILSRMI